ncbi:ankyrin repeat and SAM domain-containing protein 3 [Exaiptasia diaphana]|uniref:SAM domain-containing protein n=1 Tax=Exaiptasia diaphana TaxID=2652724 RepID=A0A913XIL5_EXADI|nr:ankyrin repeat and SAM domain-containing protein 3 [Exaiptasia diaphana]KXJ11595.1 Ankyrin repeat and SAM domain-containing protein 3 [Exaiptasia diaphana]
MNVFAEHVIGTVTPAIFEMSGDFHTDSVCPWSEDEEEIVPMDIWTASSLGDYDFVRDFLYSESKNTINNRNPGGWSPLMYASYVGHFNIVTMLLEKGNVDVDARSGGRSATALMLAASCGKEEVVEFLLHNHADINAADARGYTPLLYATLYRHSETIVTLVKLGADLKKSENIHGLTPLLLAAKEGHEKIFEIIWNLGGDIKAQTAKGLTAIELAYQYGHSMAIVNLIEYRTKRNSVVRSEADISFLHPELASSPGSSNWDYGSPGTGIKAGPKAFARLVNQKSSSSNKHFGIHITAGNTTSNTQFLKGPEIVRPGTSSPRTIPPNNRLPDSQGSSYDDLFFEQSGGTIKDSSLNERLMKLELQSNGVMSPPRSGGFSPQFPDTLVSEFLHDINLGKYLPVFTEEEVDFDTLLTLSENDLVEIGINLLGPRRKIIKAIPAWKERRSTRKPSITSLQNELSELNMQLQERTLQLQQQELYIKEEKKLRSIAEGCIVEEKEKNLQAKFKAQKVANSVRQTLPELDGLSQILSSLCDKTNDDVTKEVFTKLAGSVDKITPILKEIAENEDNITKQTHSKDLTSECVHSKSG